jgi:dihydrofolate reductase
MPSAMRSTVTLHVVSSLDGFIAKKDISVSWMDSDQVYERGVADDGAEVIELIDCYVLGARTYEHALELGWPYGDTPAVVVTHRELPRTRESVEFYTRAILRDWWVRYSSSIQKHLGGGWGDVRPEFSEAWFGG